MSRTSYSEELAQSLVEAVAGGSTISAACEAPGMPNKNTVTKWMLHHPEFGAMMDKARTLQADAMADEVPYIADTDPDPQRAKNRMEARKWYAGVMRPKKYGPKLDLTVEDRTDYGAKIDEARRRKTRMILTGSATQIIEDAQIVPTQALPPPQEPALVIPVGVGVPVGVRVPLAQREEVDPFE